MNDNYHAWEINYKDFPRTGTFEEQVKFFCSFGILAASIHNTQPWKFTLSESTLEVTPDWKYKLPHSDVVGKNILISLGCCLLNIQSIAAYHGFDTQMDLETTSLRKTKATIRFTQTHSKLPLADLAPFITKRFSNKLRYQDKPVPQEVINALLNTSKEEVSFTSDRQQLQTLSRLQGLAIARMASHPSFRKELSGWLRTNDSDAYDGMPGFVAGLSPQQARVGKKLMPHVPASMKILAKKDSVLLSTSPAAGIISMNDDSLVSWIRTGQLYEEIALRAISLGVFVTPMHAVIEDYETIDEVAELFSTKYKPQMLFRIGYNTDKPYHTPRRHISTFFAMNTEKQLADSLKIPNSIQKIKVNRFDINYITAGKGDPILLLHGGNMGWGQWYPNIPELAKHNEVIGMDLPGGGRSTRLDFKTLDFQKDLVDVVREFITALQLKNLTLVGSSVSGWVAAQIALQNPELVKKLILVDAVGFTDKTQPPDRIIGIYTFAKFLSQTVFKPVRTNKKLEMLLRGVFFNKQIALRPEFIDYFYETMETSHNLLFISRMSSPRGVPKEIVLGSEVSKISVPTLVLWGEKDGLMKFADCEPQIKLIPHVQIKTLPEAGHIPNIEKSDLFNKEVESFLKS